MKGSNVFEWLATKVIGAREVVEFVDICLKPWFHAKVKF